MSRITFRILTSAFLILFLAPACASRKINPNTDWNARIGNYTFREAVAELGRPDAVGGTPDGAQTAEWLVERGPGLSFGFGVGGGSYGRHGGAGVGAGTSVTPPRRVDFLRLSFGADGMLKSWERSQPRH